MTGRFGLVALGLATACRGGGESRIVGSTVPCRLQQWMRAPVLATNPVVRTAVAPAQFMDVPSEWLTLADGSGYFVGIGFGGSPLRDGALVVFTCEGRHVLTQWFGPSAWVRLIPASPTDGPAPSYLTVLASRGDSGGVRSLETYYRFHRSRLEQVGQLIRKRLVRQDSTHATEESATLSWRVAEPRVIQRCVESRPLHWDPMTGAWSPDPASPRYFAEVYRLEGGALRLVTRADRCLAEF